MKLTLPLHYQSTKKKKVLYSLNQFLLPLGTEATRNTYHQWKAKKHLIALATEQATEFDPVENYPVDVILHVYRPSNHRMDMGNLSILEKYATDALVAAGKLEDDSWKFIRSIKIEMMGLDEENPRVEYEVIENEGQQPDSTGSTEEESSD